MRLRKLTPNQPGYGAATRLLWETSRPLSLAVPLYTVASAVLPNVVLVAAGRVGGDVPAAARDGLSSAAGDRLIGALAITGIAYAATLLLGPVQSALSSVVKWRLVYRTQDRLIAAVSGPEVARETVGIGDLAKIDDPPALARALHRPDATALTDELREGLATPLGRSFSNGQELSGGQWQRIALARGMMRRRAVCRAVRDAGARLPLSG